MGSQVPFLIALRARAPVRCFSTRLRAISLPAARILVFFIDNLQI